MPAEEMGTVESGMENGGGNCVSSDDDTEAAFIELVGMCAVPAVAT
jgi:hypothetical protein